LTEIQNFQKRVQRYCFFLTCANFSSKKNHLPIFLLLIWIFSAVYFSGLSPRTFLLFKGGVSKKSTFFCCIYKLFFVPLQPI